MPHLKFKCDFSKVAYSKKIMDNNLNFTDYTIKPATWDDLPFYIAFYELTFCESVKWQPKQLLTWMGTNNAVLYLMWHKTRIVGSVTVAKKTDSAGVPYNNIFAVAIHPDYRRKGLAKHMLQTVIGKNAETWILKVYITNEPARRLYESLGFDLYASSGIEAPDTLPADMVYYRLLR